ncbi:hypothetical protein [Martelella mediterranea]|uniref:hypothetical protein n=1 Tax=Martelella mediterranea TaxID=293089 RepID=UPI000372C7CE|nr:hypothetical protein [Martelella mediterranea]
MIKLDSKQMQRDMTTKAKDAESQARISHVEEYRDATTDRHAGIEEQLERFTKLT